ncbi:MAG: carbon starvation protein A [Bacteroidaceae bacterium]|nr:carbon starvation protein A [Bacteroidaceae bacterium]
MASFVISLVVLLAGYFVYGTFIEKVFGADGHRPMPCDTLRDGVDFTPMPTWKVYTVQFLNIAGTGPIFGALMGILYGPAAFLWIVLGCLLGGAMHDYMAGMISIRRGGASLPEIIGDELGSASRLVMRIVSLVLMICVGASFIMIPAGLMSSLMSGFTDSALLTPNLFWTVLMFAFYLCVTVFSVSKIMGNIYPVFGLALLVMAVLVGVCIFTEPGSVPSLADAFSDHYPVREGVTPLFPGLFITIACGAVSGFHATQSPMMARCIKNERYGLRCFYGAMVTEGVVALIWAAASIKYAGSYQHLYDLMSLGGTQKVNPALVVDMMCRDWLGTAGLVLAVLGIVAAPISTGGSAFRAARLIFADFTGYGQRTVVRRVALSLPLFLLAVVMLNVSSFKVLWLYVSWFNQVLATFTFFTIAHFLRHRSDGSGICPRWSWLLAFFPAVFMCSVSACFILIDVDNGFGLPHLWGYVIGGLITLMMTALFLKYQFKS